MKTFKEFFNLKNEVSQHHLDHIEEKLSELEPSDLPLNDLFKGKYRTTIPFDNSNLSRLKSLIQSRYNTKDFPGLIDYEIDWIKGQIIAKYKNPNAGKSFIDKKTRKETIVPEYGQKKINIAKFLKNTDEEMLNWWSSFMDNTAISPEDRKSMAEEVGKYSILISRHPIDILRMSDFSWHSCHGPGESYFRCAKQESVDGGGIAYLVNTDDLKNIDLDEEEIFSDADRGKEGLIDDPKGRIRIKRYTSKFPDEKTGEEFDFAVPETRIYGTRVEEFGEKVTNWLRQEQNDLIKRNGGRTEFRIKNFVLRGGSYRDSTDASLFNNFFDDELDSGNTVHEFQGEESLVDIADQYREELDEMQDNWDQELKHCYVRWEEYDWDGPFEYAIYGGVSIKIPSDLINEEPEEDDVTEGENSLTKRLYNHGIWGLGEEGAWINLDSENLEIHLEVIDEERNIDEDGRHPDDFNNYCRILKDEYDDNYDKIVAITKDWLIENNFAHYPPARELETEIEEGKIKLNHFHLYERDKDEPGVVSVQAEVKLPIKPSPILSGKGGMIWDLGQQLGKPQMANMINQIHRMFLGSLASAARNYDRQQWLPFMDKPPNPYIASKSGLPKINVYTDMKYRIGSNSESIIINVEYELNDNASKEEIENIRNNLQIFDKNWDGLISSAQQVIQNTLWNKEQEEIQKAQGDQQKLSALLGAKQRPSSTPQNPETLFKEPEMPRTYADNLRDKILKRGKYAPKEETP